MNEKDLRNLQVYIGKRNLGQSDEDVIRHVKGIDKKTSLSQEEWHRLIIPCCNNGMATILKYVLEQIIVLEGVKEYMVHTVYGRNPDLDQKRIEVLKILMEYADDANRRECLSETMLHAGWFGETEIVRFLIENGADREYTNPKGLNLETCAERAASVFHDPSLREYLQRAG